MSPSWLKQGDEKSKQCALCQRVLYNKGLPSRGKDFTWVSVLHPGEGHLSNSSPLYPSCLTKEGRRKGKKHF